MIALSSSVFSLSVIITVLANVAVGAFANAVPSVICISSPASVVKYNSFGVVFFIHICPKPMSSVSALAISFIFILFFNENFLILPVPIAK